MSSHRRNLNKMESLRVEYTNLKNKPSTAPDTKAKYLNALAFCDLLDKLYFKNQIQEITTTNKVTQYVFTKTMTFNAIYDYKNIDFSIIEKENPVLVNQTIPKDYTINLSPEITNSSDPRSQFMRTYAVDN